MAETDQIYKQLEALSSDLKNHMSKSTSDANDMKLSLQEIKQYQESDRNLLHEHDEKLKEWDSIRDFGKGIFFIVGALWLGITGFVSWVFSKH